MPVEALVLDEVARVPRRPTPREVRRRADDGHADVAGHGDRDHVAVDHLAELDAGVEASGDDVHDRVAHHEVEPHVRVAGEEVGEREPAEHRVHRGPDEQAYGAAWGVAQLPERGDGGAHLLERRAHRGVEPLARLGEVDAPRRALHEGHAELPLQLAERLAHGRRAHAQPLAGGAEAARLGHRGEHRHRVQVVSHREAILTGRAAPSSRSAARAGLYSIARPRYPGHRAGAGARHRRGARDERRRRRSDWNDDTREPVTTRLPRVGRDDTGGRQRPEPAERPAPTGSERENAGHTREGTVPRRGHGGVRADRPHRRMSFQRRALGPKDVAIKIHFGAICHSDIHTIRGDWGPVTFPQIVGHEITGTVVAVGSSASKFAVGARVGVGTMVNSCRVCAECQAGHENYCLNGNVQTYASKDRDGTITQGGYSTFIVVDEDFVIGVPDALDLAAAAPLMCAGITVYSPLRRWGVSGGKQVAVVHPSGRRTR
jgi:hypothetical protein